MKRCENPTWFFDESGFQANGSRKKVLAPKGSRPSRPYTGDHLRENVMGAVNPQTGELFTLMVSCCDTRSLQAYLDEFNKHLDGQHVCLVLDNASWHKTKALRWGNIVPVYLPPYSPHLNAIEPLWKVLKDRMPVLSTIKTADQLNTIVCNNIKTLINNPQEVKSICKISDKIT